MNYVVKSFDVLSNSGDELAHFELFVCGSVLEVRTRSEIIHVGIGAEAYYKDCLETNKMLATITGDKVIEKR